MIPQLLKEKSPCTGMSGMQTKENLLLIPRSDDKKGLCINRTNT